MAERARISDVPARPRVAVLDDYQGVALAFADWSGIQDKAEVVVFREHFATSAELVESLKCFDVLCVMRERTPLPAELLSELPRLRLIASTGPGNASIDTKAAAALGIQVVNTGYFTAPAIELTWALILASARNIVAEHLSIEAGGWQREIGRDLAGATLGVLGVGRIGSAVARIGRAFDMDVIAWSQNLTEEQATAAGARLVSRHELLCRSDFLSIHLVLSDRTRGLVSADEFALMKSTAWLINTARGPIVDELALLDAVARRRIGGAAIDVFEVEPLPVAHPLRHAPNILATPHIGYVTQGLYRRFFEDTVAGVERWLAQLETDQ